MLVSDSNGPTGPKHNRIKENINNHITYVQLQAIKKSDSTWTRYDFSTLAL
jgi:hypothetical protein